VHGWNKKNYNANKMKQTNVKELKRLEEQKQIKFDKIEKLKHDKEGELNNAYKKMEQLENNLIYLYDTKTKNSIELEKAIEDHEKNPGVIGDQDHRINYQKI